MLNLSFDDCFKLFYKLIFNGEYKYEYVKLLILGHLICTNFGNIAMNNFRDERKMMLTYLNYTFRESYYASTHLYTSTHQMIGPIVSW